jgi:putative flippase GtrA
MEGAAHNGTTSAESPASDRVSAATPRSGMRVHLFTVLSGVGWLLDFTLYGLLVIIGIGPFVANLCGAASGVSFVFLMSRRYLFARCASSLGAAVLRYGLWNVVAIASASAGIAVLASGLAGSADFASFVDLLRATIDWIARSAPTAAVLSPVLDTSTTAAAVAKLAVTPLTMYSNYLVASWLIEGRVSWR